MISVGEGTQTRRLDAAFPRWVFDRSEALTATQELARLVLRTGSDIRPGSEDYAYFVEEYEDATHQTFPVPGRLAIGKTAHGRFDRMGMRIDTRASFLGEVAMIMPEYTDVRDGEQLIGTVELDASHRASTAALNAFYLFHSNGYVEVSGEMNYSGPGPSDPDEVLGEAVVFGVVLTDLALNPLIPTQLAHPDTYLRFRGIQVGAPQIERLARSAFTGLS